MVWGGRCVWAVMVVQFRGGFCAWHPCTPYMHHMCTHFHMHHTLHLHHPLSCKHNINKTQSNNYDMLSAKYDVTTQPIYRTHCLDPTVFEKRNTYTVCSHPFLPPLPSRCQGRLQKFFITALLCCCPGVSRVCASSRWVLPLSEVESCH